MQLVKLVSSAHLCTWIFEPGRRNVYLKLSDESLMIQNSLESGFCHSLYPHPSNSVSSEFHPHVFPARLSKSPMRILRACILKEGDITPKGAEKTYFFNV